MEELKNYLLTGLVNYPVNFVRMFIDMGFYLLIGMFFSGLLHVLFSQNFISRHLGKKGFGSIFKAALIGVPLPLCSCGVMPTAVGLSKSGASKGAVTSFLISTPQTGVDSIIATYGLMGPLYAIARPLVAFVSGIVGGLIVQLSEMIPQKGKTKEEKSEEQRIDETNHACCNHHHEKKEEHRHCCSHNESHKEEESCHESGGCCCSHNKAHESCCTHKSIGKKLGCKIKELFLFGFLNFTEEIFRPLLLGMIIAVALSTFINPTFINHLGINRGFLGMLLMLIIGLPMYICSTSSIPLAVSFLNLGFSPGAVFVFLFAGPVANIAAMTVLGKTLGKKTVAIYVVTISVMAILFGMLFDLIVNIYSLQFTIKSMPCYCCTLLPTPLYKKIAAGIFLLLLFYAVIIKIMRKIKNQKKHDCCCN